MSDDQGPETPRRSAWDQRERLNGTTMSAANQEIIGRIEVLELKAKGIDEVSTQIGDLTREVAELTTTMRIVGRNVARLMTVQNLEPAPLPLATPRSASPMPGRLELRSEQDLDRALTEREAKKLGLRVRSLGDKIASAAIVFAVTAIGAVAVEEVRHMHESPVTQPPRTP
jgi:hypothetical protein